MIIDPGCLQSDSRDPAITRFITGAFVFTASSTDLLADLMSPVVHVRGADVVADRLGSLLTVLGAEALESRPGRSLILNRLLEIILVETLRYQPIGFTETRPGLLAVLADPTIGSALQIMQHDSQRPWTLASWRDT